MTIRSIAARTPLPERNLDILRAAAVLCVFLEHVLESSGRDGRLLKWIGQAGVLAFFVHTSLVLMASLERDGAPERGAWVRRFYLRRAWRIYPLAWAVILLIYVLRIPNGFYAQYEYVPLAKLAANLGLVMDLANQNPMLGVLWSLPIEVQMYVTLPFCYLVARRRPAWSLLALIAAGLAIAWSFYYGIQERHRIPGMYRLQMLQFIPCFLFGVTAYWMLRRRAAASRAWPALPWWTWPLLIVAALALFAPTYNVWSPRLFTRVPFCLMLALGIAFVREARASWFTRAAHTIAVYSYGIYLIHPLALRVGFRALPGQPFVLQLAVTFAVLVPACWVAYHAVEKPGIALGQRLADRWFAPADRGSLEATAPAP